MIYTDVADNPLKSLFQNLFGGTGVSEEAITPHDRVQGIIIHLSDNQSIGAKLQEGYRLLEKVAEEHNEPNWDGYDALPINGDSLRKAYEFIQILPLSLPLPEIEVDPDGEVSFDWYNDSGGVFSVSIGETGRLSFAGAFGRREVHGVDYFDDEIPTPILIYLQQLLGLK